MPFFAVWLKMPRRAVRIVCVWSLLGGCTAVAQLSEKIRAEVMTSFPKFEPPPAEQPPTGTTSIPQPLSDDPLVNLPDYHIKEKRVIVRDPDLWLSKRALDRKAMSDYSDSMTDLEWALNCWYIPFVTASPQARANAAYAGKKMAAEHKRLTSLAQTLSRLDSAEAKKLLRDLDLSRHPGK